MLGAGFSKDLAAFPTLPELSRMVNEEIDALPDSGTTTFLRNQVPPSVRQDLEHLVTYLLQEYPWRDPEEAYLAKAGYVLVSRTIQQILTRKEQETDIQALVGSPVSDLLAYWHKWEATVISFNYDTLVERIAEHSLRRKSVDYEAIAGENFGFLHRLTVRCGTCMPTAKTWTAPDLEWNEDTRHLQVIVPNAGATPEEVLELIRARQLIPEEHFARDVQNRIKGALDQLQRSVPLQMLYPIPLNNINGRTASLWSAEHSTTFRLLKLHGSTNWYYSGRSDFAGEQLYFALPPRSAKAEASLALNASDLVPLMIPPTLDKSSFYVNNSLRAQWKMAAEALRVAAHVYVIGYSCPPTDLATSFMMQEGLTRGKAQVHVYCKGSDQTSHSGRELCSRYLRLVGGDATRLHVEDLGASESSIAKLVQDLGTCLTA